jgi:hypothetical protein
MFSYLSNVVNLLLQLGHSRLLLMAEPLSLSLESITLLLPPPQ